MASLFDHPALSSSLFMPHRNEVPPPPRARDHFVDVAPDARLQLRVHEREGTVATLLLFHGNGESAASYDALAGHFARAGVDLMVAEFRGYGQSTGEPTLRACLTDAAPVLAAARSLARHRALVVMGRSLGSLCAAELCKRDGAFAGLVLDSAPADIYGTLRRRGMRVDAPLLEEDLEDFCPLRKLRRFRGPALVLHGAEDALVPPGDAQLACGALDAARAELVVIPGRGHNNLSDHPRYWEALGGLVARAVTAALPPTAPPHEEALFWCAGRSETAAPVGLRTPRFEAAAFSARGRNYKDFNEDAALARTDANGAVYAAVFDQAGGLGGRVRGEGSEVAARALGEAFARLAGGRGETADDLAAVFRQAHERLRARGEREVTTAVALVARGETVTVANLGDSGALHLAVDGGVTRRTERHRFQTFQGHSDLTYALGRFDWHPPDIERWTICAGEWVVLGTDGLLDNVGDDAELSDLVRRSASATGLVAALVDRALRAMEGDPSRGDNLSVVVLRALAAGDGGPSAEAPEQRAT